MLVNQSPSAAHTTGVTIHTSAAPPFAGTVSLTRYAAPALANSMARLLAPHQPRGEQAEVWHVADERDGLRHQPAQHTSQLALLHARRQFFGNAQLWRHFPPRRQQA